MSAGTQPRAAAVAVRHEQVISSDAALDEKSAATINLDEFMGMLRDGKLIDSRLTVRDVGQRPFVHSSIGLQSRHRYCSRCRPRPVSGPSCPAMSSTRLPRFPFRSFGTQVPIVKQIFTNIQRDAADEDDATGGPTGAADCMRCDSTGRAA